MASRLRISEDSSDFIINKDNESRFICGSLVSWKQFGAIVILNCLKIKESDKLSSELFPRNSKY